MKPMFRVLSFTVLTSTLLFSSCVKDLYDPEVIAEKNPDAEIPVEFLFGGGLQPESIGQQ